MRWPQAWIPVKRGDRLLLMLARPTSNHSNALYTAVPGMIHYSPLVLVLEFKVNQMEFR